MSNVALSNKGVRLVAEADGVKIVRDLGFADEFIATFSWAQIQRLLDYRAEKWPP